MNQPAQQPEPPRDMRSLMPRTAKWVDQARQKYGSAYVDQCIRRAMRGERSQFYAVEAGHFLGAPFDWTPSGAYMVSMSILTGAPFVAAFREPAGDVAMSVTPAPGVQGGNDGAH